VSGLVELRGGQHRPSRRLWARAASRRSGCLGDQLPDELRQRGEDRDDRPSAGCCRVQRRVQRTDPPHGAAAHRPTRSGPATSGTTGPGRRPPECPGRK
jgi:hypothetical protein